MTMKKIYWYKGLAYILLLLSSHAYTQTSSFLSGGIDEYFRRNQLNKLSSSQQNSFTLRSFTRNLLAVDTLFPLTSIVSVKSSASLSSGYLPLSLETVYNTHHPYGWNDGALIPANGASVKLSGGVYFTSGHFSVNLQPEIVISENRKFETFFETMPDTTWTRYYQWLNRVDIPDRFGEHSYKKILGGQSSIRYNWNAVSAGISTENMWWGPGIRNALVMSNNAPGFLHLTFNTLKPIQTKIGSFEWQIIGGLLENSGVLPPDIYRRYTTGTSFLYVPKNNEQRYLTGMMLSWQPHWVKGLFVGFAKTSYQYKSDISGIADILPLEGLFKSKTEKEGKKASLGSLFARYVMPEEMAEVYIEYGRNDRSPNLVNIFSDSKYPRAYVAGMRKLLATRKESFIEVTGEVTQMQLPTVPDLIYKAESWYTHGFVRQGYTNQGQVIGAGIGPGSNSQMIGLAWIKGIKKVGVVFERIVHNNDFYYNAFEDSQDFRRHWIDLSTTVSADWSYQRFLFSARLSLIRSLNYQWWYIDVVPLTSPTNYFRNGYDVLNFNAHFSFSYRL